MCQDRAGSVMTKVPPRVVSSTAERPMRRNPLNVRGFSVSFDAILTACNKFIIIRLIEKQLLMIKLLSVQCS